MNEIRRLPPMHALAAFEAAARLQGFARAAEELCVTQSAISHRIRQLEEHLGVRLFVRVHKQVVLTPPGQAFLTEVRESMRRLSAAAGRVTAGPAAKLRVTASPALASTVLIPHLKDYFEQCGYLDLEIDTSARVIDLGEDRFDLALRFGTGDWPGYAAELLVEEQISALSSPAYAKSFGDRRTVSSLSNATLISSKAFAWGQWLKAVGASKPLPVAERLVFVDVAPAIDAAVHGLGVVLANRGTTVSQRRSGSLVPFVEASVHSHRHYYGVYRSDSPQYDSIRKFLDWMKPLVLKTFV